MFVLTVGYVDIKTICTNKIFLYYWKNIYILFIDCLYYLSVHFHSCCFYNQYHGCIREITSMPVSIFCFTLCSILLTWWRNIRLFYTSYLRYKKVPNLNLSPPPSPLFVATPLLILQHSYTSVFALTKDVSRSLPKVDDRAFLLFWNEHAVVKN